MQNEQEIKNLINKKDTFADDYINNYSFENDIEKDKCIKYLKKIKPVQIYKYIIKDASFFEKLNGIEIGRYGHFLKTVYIITNKKIINAALIQNGSIINAINSNNIKFIHRKQNLDVYKLNLFEEYEDIMLLLTNLCATWDIIVQYENNINVDNGDVAMFGCEFVYVQYEKDFDKYIKLIKCKKIKTFGHDNVLTYENNSVNKYYDDRDQINMKFLNFKTSNICYNWIETDELDNFL